MPNIQSRNSLDFQEATARSRKCRSWRSWNGRKCQSCRRGMLELDRPIRLWAMLLGKRSGKLEV